MFDVTILIWGRIRFLLQDDRVALKFASGQQSGGRIGLTDIRLTQQARQILLSSNLYGTGLGTLIDSSSRASLQLSSRVMELLDSLPAERYGAQNTGPRPLPLFLSPPPGMEALNWESLVWQALGPEIPRDRIVLIRQSSKRAARRAPFKLPLRIATQRGRAAQAVQRLRRASWYRSSDAVRRFGILLREFSPPKLVSTLRSEPTDILIVPRLDASMLDRLGGLRLEQRPRLILCFSRAEQPEKTVDAWKAVPSGASLVVLPEPVLQPEAFAADFLYELTHDVPLHEALKAAERISGSNKTLPTLLFSNPLANQQLRLAEALREMRNAAASIMNQWQGLRPKMIHRLLPVPRGLSLSLPGTKMNLSNGLREIQKRTRSIRNIDLSFGQESEGLRPLAQAYRDFDEVKPLEKELENRLSQSTDEQVEQELRKKQRRFVDIHMSELHPQAGPIQLFQHSTLKPNAFYELNVHIGQRIEGSLVSGPSSSVDPLLKKTPEKKGYDLEVAIQPHEFKPRGKVLKALYLPPFGSSEPVSFQVQAPDGTGEKTLRVLVYQQNQLLQAFLLTSLVTESNKHRQTPGLVAEQVFSQSERFHNLESLKPRKISIGANQNGSDASHQLHIKGAGASGLIDLSSRAFEDSIDEFRRLLLQASLRPDSSASNPRGRVYPSVELDQPLGEDFRRQFAELALFGFDLHGHLIDWAAGRRRPIIDILQQVRTSDDQVLQVVRFDKNFAFPWTTLYDYSPPDWSVGDPAPQVCRGWIRQKGKVSRCGHQPNDDVFCANGFWGIRHQIEEMTEGTTSDALTSIQIAERKGSLRCVSYDGFLDAKRLFASWSKDFGQLVELGPGKGQELAKLVWKDDARPQILVIFAHHDEKNGIALTDRDWLTERQLKRERVKHRSWTWKQPRPMVLLLTCNSGATASSIPGNFLTHFYDSGASAVVATETIMFTKLGARLADSLIRSLLGSDSKRSVGGALLDFRRDLVRSGNPLFFLFNCLGPADLTFRLKKRS